MKQCDAPRGARREFWNRLRRLAFFANLLAGTLPRHGLFHSALLARLEVVGVTFNFLDDVFALDLALEPTQSTID